MLFRGGAAVRAVYMIRRSRVAFTWSTITGVTPLDVLGSGAIAGFPAVLSGEYSVGALLKTANSLRSSAARCGRHSVAGIDKRLGG